MEQCDYTECVYMFLIQPPSCLRLLLGPAEQRGCAIPPLSPHALLVCVSHRIGDPAPPPTPYLISPVVLPLRPTATPPLTPCLGQRQLPASPMTAWIVLPVSLAAFSITGIWIV